MSNVIYVFYPGIRYPGIQTYVEAKSEIAYFLPTSERHDLYITGNDKGYLCFSYLI